MLRGRDHLQQVGVDGRFAAGELDDLGVPLQFDEAVKHSLHLGEGQVEAGARIREADRTIEVAGAVHFDECQAGVLSMLGAEATIQRAALQDLRRDACGCLPGLVVLRLVHIRAGIGVDQPFEPAVIVATLAHIDLTIAQEHLRIDDRAALRADGARDLVEDLALGTCLRRQARRHGGRLDPGPDQRTPAVARRSPASIRSGSRFSAGVSGQE
ncbi:MAG: hypothetical protein WKF78_12295 [Candidatus Limnocylindrales bacterium]